MYRLAGELRSPTGQVTQYLEPVRQQLGLGRWIYCKYCYKNVLPVLSGINQVVCSECGCGLTPDFYTLKALKRWLTGDGDYDEIMKEDKESEEAKAWRASHHLGEP